MSNPNRVKIHIVLPAAAVLVLWLLITTAPAQSRFGIQSPATVIDQGGRKITVRKPFERIISLYGAHTENLYQLGMGRKIVGVSRHEDYPPEASAKPVFSYHDDPEKFLAARPDLVLIRPMIDRGYPALISRLEKNGITVVSLQPGTVEEMYVYWEILGALTGKAPGARVLISRFKQAAFGLKDLTSKMTARKRVYFEAIHRKMKTFAPDAMAIFALETAGGINIAADARPVRNTNIAAYGKERILSHAAEIDVYLAQHGAMNRPTKARIRNEPGFEIIKAVRNDEIYIVDEQIVSRPTPRLLTGIWRIGRILYPAIFDQRAQKIVTLANQAPE